jgi:hypothetical protein
MSTNLWHAMERDQSHCTPSLKISLNPKLPAMLRNAFHCVPGTREFKISRARRCAR